MENEYDTIKGCYPYEGGIRNGIDYQDSLLEEPSNIENSKLVASVKE